MGVIQDQTTGDTLKIDPTFKAARISLRPAEVLAWQSLGAQTGLLTTVAANGAIFSLQNKSANLLMIRRLGIGYLCSTPFTAAQKVDFGLMIARAFTVADTGGTAIAITGSNGKHRTALNTLTSIDCRIATTGALTAGTKTLDTNHIAQVGGWAGAAGTIIAPSQDNLLSHNAGDYPIILGQNEGINIMNLTLGGAAGVGTAYVNLEFAEVAAF